MQTVTIFLPTPMQYYPTAPPASYDKFAYVEEDNEEGTDEVILERAFYLFNVGDPMEFDVVARYRAPRPVTDSSGNTLSVGLRSLSIGDIVDIDGRTYRCASSGWDRIEMPADVQSLTR